MMSKIETELLLLIEEREHVLFELERALFTKRYEFSKKHFNILSVHTITIIYSIWEGFIQQAFQIYVKYLNSLNIELNNFSEEIVVFHMENKFKQLYDYPKKTNKKVKFFMELKNHYSENIQNIYPYVNAEDNVSFNVLNKILITFSLEPFSEYWEKYKHPNPNLKESLDTFLRYRNGVSHGGDISSEEKVTQEVYNKYKNLVIDLMYGIYNKILKGIKDKTYLKK